MKSTLLLWAAFALLPLFLCAQTADTTAIIWRGFEHNWTYNHRINRLGSYVQYAGGKPVCAHASASGMGADSTKFSCFFSRVQSSGLWFQEGVAEVEISGKERHLLAKTVRLRIPAAAQLRDKEQQIALLNGFEVQAVGGADKLQTLHLELGELEYARETGEFLLSVHLLLLVNCETLECSMWSQRTNYQFRIYYLLAAGADADFANSEQRISRISDWDKREEIAHEDEKIALTGVRGGVYPAAFVGLRGFRVQLDAAHWLAGYHSHATPLQYDAQRGRMEALVDLFFKEWIFGMKRQSAYPPHSKFSKRKKGWAVQELDLVLVQLRKGKIQHEKRSGSMFWRARNAPPTAAEALQIIGLD